MLSAQFFNSRNNVTVIAVAVGQGKIDIFWLYSPQWKGRDYYTEIDVHTSVGTSIQEIVKCFGFYKITTHGIV
jgi:hypothetical protein